MGKIFKLFKVISYIGAIGLVIAIVFLPMFTQAEATITVQEKIRTGGDDSKFLVWSEEGEVYENTDYLFFGKFNSADLQGQLKVGETYTCKVAGVRVQFFSWYRNIIRCE